MASTRYCSVSCGGGGIGGLGGGDGGGGDGGGGEHHRENLIKGVGRVHLGVSCTRRTRDSELPTPIEYIVATETGTPMIAQEFGDVEVDFIHAETMQRVPLRLTNVALVQNRNLFLVSVASML
ncbi:hypothetical protein RI054_38g141930 [Pseudoscourfieldia marina]